MRRLRSMVLTGMALAGLAACDDFQAPPARDGGTPAAARPSAFSHALTDDVSGYYMPVTEAVVGRHRLTHLFLGQASAFERWEGGGGSRTFGPVMLEFEDNAGGTVRVLPTAYAVSDGRVRFSGDSPDLGRVSFDGSLDQGALATARRNLGDEAPVLSGTLRVGGRSFGGQKFRWYGGD